MIFVNFIGLFKFVTVKFCGQTEDTVNCAVEFEIGLQILIIERIKRIFQFIGPVRVIPRL